MFTAVAALLLVAAVNARPEAPITLVACAPGYPGSTAEAQPSMDALASAVTRGAEWPQGSITGVYVPEEQEGLARLSRRDAAVALVPLPFFVQHGRDLKLSPHLAAVAQGASGPSEVWTLVAAKGRVGSPAALAGYTLASSAGYAPGFVRAALAGWGQLPPDLHIVASSQVLSNLRRAASGERMAVLLDGAQAAALPSLPFAGQLEVVARSEPAPGALVTTVSDRLSADRWRALERAFLGLQRAEGGPAVLQGLQLAAFASLDPAARAVVERLASKAAGGG